MRGRAAVRFGWLLLTILAHACSENDRATPRAGNAGATTTGGDASGGAGGASSPSDTGGRISSGGTSSGGRDGTMGGVMSGGSPSGGRASGGRASGGGGDPQGGTGGAMSTGGAEPATGGAIASPGGTSGSSGVPVSVVVFSRTAVFRHDSIEKGVTAISELGKEREWEVLATEDPAIFAGNGLRGRNVVVFLNTSGDVLNAEQQAGFEQFIREGNGYVGIHAASDTEYDWPWYGELVGAYFREHPETQTADVIVEDATHAATRGLPNPWRRTDEWYGFRMNPRARVNVLLALDEASYSPAGSNMGGDHPIAWFHEYDGGRAFYTGLGHTIESYSDAQFLSHLSGAIEWAAGK